MNSARTDAALAGLPDVETRALHLRPDDIAAPGDAARVVEWAEHAGFNIIVFDACLSGWCNFPPATRGRGGIPRQVRNAGSRDLLGEVCSAAVDTGLAVYAAVTVLHAGEMGGRAGLLAKSAKRMLIRNAAGTPIMPGAPARSSVFLCPSNIETRRYLGSVIAEIAMRYPVDGFLLDWPCPPGMTQHPEATICRCPACQAGVDRDLLFSLLNLQPDKADPGFMRWVRWREEQVEQLLTTIRSRVRGIRTGVRFLARIPASEPLGEPWSDWAENGLIHALVAGSSHAGTVAGIVVLRDAEARSGESVTDAVRAAQQSGTSGFVIRLAAGVPDGETVEVFERPAVAVESAPRAAAGVLIRRAVIMLDENRPICEALSDIMARTSAGEDRTGEDTEAAAAAVDYLAEQVSETGKHEARSLLLRAAELLRLSAAG